VNSKKILYSISAFITLELQDDRGAAYTFLLAWSLFSSMGVRPRPLIYV